MQASGDALSDVLRLVQLKACIYFIRDMPTPWGMDIPRSVTGPLHMVLQGECLLRCDGKDYPLQAGDAILLPHGASHQMLDSPVTVPEPASVVMEQLFDEQCSPGNTSFTRMLCGHFEWDGACDHQIFKELPDLIVVQNVFNTKSAAKFKQVIELITTEAGEKEPGSSAIADHLGEVLFVIMLRAWLLENMPHKGLLAAIHDVRLTRALSHIHTNPASEIDLQVLAQIAGMSRTSFAVRFRDVMGITPAAYVTEWRLMKARELLLQGDLPVSLIVERVGYRSDTTFVRAFKRRFGETPGKTRRIHSEEKRFPTELNESN